MIYNAVLGSFSTRYSIRMHVQFSNLELQLKTLLKQHFPLHTYLLSVFTANLITLALTLSLCVFMVIVDLILIRSSLTKDYNMLFMYKFIVWIHSSLVISCIL